MAKAELLLRAEEPELRRRLAALFREAIFSPKRRAGSTTTSRSSTSSNRRDPSAAGASFAGLLPLKSIDGKSKSGLYRPHENKYNWINSGVLLFGRDGVSGRRSADGHMEAERGQIEVHTRHTEVRHRDPRKHIRDHKSDRGRHRRER